MVATRNHPSDFQDPDEASVTQESPRKRTTRRSAAANGSSPTITTSSDASLSPALPSPTRTPARATASSQFSSSRTSLNKYGWTHTPSNMTLIWLAISLPLVIWDTGYVLLRPYSMPGGKLHYPIWAPYALYGTIDHVYGFKAYEAKSGWTAAQGSINALETALYFVYIYLVYTYGEQERKQGRGAPDRSSMGKLRALSESRTVYGKTAAWAVILGYSVATVTFWKTILYWLIEAFSGFDNIGHNSLSQLIFLWIIPNGAWLVFPAYMIYVFGQEILEGLEVATESRRYR